MRDTKLVIVEGIMGSGKTSTAEYIAYQMRRCGVNARFVPEGSDALRIWALEKPPPPYMAPPDEPVLKHTADTYIEQSLKNWHAFAEEIRASSEVRVLDGHLFHGGVDELLYIDTPWSRIMDYARDIEDITAGLHPALIHLYQEDVARAMRATYARRGRKWEDIQINWKVNSPYCRKRDFEGFAGLIQLYIDYRSLTDQIFTDLTMEKLAVEISGGEWDEYCDIISQFLDISPPAKLPISIDNGVVKGNLPLIGPVPLDAVQDVVSIGGDLILKRHSRLLALGSFSNITSIGGNLDLWGNPALGSLEGLQNLRRIGNGLRCLDNPALASIKGLEHLEHLGKGLILIRNTALTDIDALKTLTTTGGSVLLSANHALTSLEGFSNVTIIPGSLEISSHSVLASLEGLHRIKRIEGDLEISYNDALQNVDGLRDLEEVTGELRIVSNPALTDFSGLNNVRSAGSVRIMGNEKISEQSIRDLTERLGG